MRSATAVVQARLGSTRFPGKMLATLGEHTLLEWVVTRTKRARSLTRVIVATTSDAVDDRLVAACEQLGVESYRGSSDDVLARFAGALVGDSADVVVRICADNPFVDPECIDVVVAELVASGSEYAFNHRPHGDGNYADGFGAEALTRPMFEKLAASRLTAAQREHVTLAIVDGSVPSRVHTCRATGVLARPELRFDIDTPADLARLETLVSSGSISLDTTATDIVERYSSVG
jgi:spore coat polysaccharide biosynthesis protein SpsF